MVEIVCTVKLPLGGVKGVIPAAAAKGKKYFKTVLGADSSRD